MKPYFTALEEEGSIYADSNKKVKEILQGIKNLMGNDLPSDSLENAALGHAEWLVKIYNEKLEKVLSEKRKQVQSKMQ